ncbi:RDD family protein [Rickettsia endosymbiont of Halotydeus destructor]|uniref:RDD family protein n=1 Tax=Rickettsia endosymbiont of Halotydeus destructor TaxID=2996754 RepID=UPI003BAF1E60
MIFRRFLAFLIDKLIIIFITEILEITLIILIFFFVNITEFNITEFSLINLWFSIKASILYIAWGTVVFWYISLPFLFIMGSFYFAYFESSKSQATPGKQLLNMKLIDMYGHRLDSVEVFFRYTALFLINITIIGFIINVIFMLFNKDRKMLHDIFFNTRVVRR